MVFPPKTSAYPFRSKHAMLRRMDGSEGGSPMTRTSSHVHMCEPGWSGAPRAPGWGRLTRYTLRMDWLRGAGKIHSVCSCTAQY